MHAKFIAEGTYGCVFSPPLKCDTEPKVPFPSNAVSKLFGKTKDYYSEKEIQEIIKLIDPQNKFTRPQYGTCDVSRFDQEDDVADCKHIELYDKVYKQLVYKDGGNDMSDFIRTTPSKSKYVTLLKHFEPIVTGLKVLADNQYVHLDIKPDNILYNMKSVFLIDFGLMTRISKVYEKKYIVDHDYPFYPPEFKMSIYKDNHEKFIERFVQNFAHKYLINDNSYNLYTEIIKSIGYSIEEQKTDFKNLSKLDLATSHDCREKIDVYSLGIVFLMIYIWSGVPQNKFRGLIKSMIYFNPIKRITISDAIKEYHKMIVDL